MDDQTAAGAISGVLTPETLGMTAGGRHGSHGERARPAGGVRPVVADTAAVIDAVAESLGRPTQTWVRTPEGWRCLAGHASLPVHRA